MSLEKALLLLTVDIAVIITVSRLLGLVFRRFFARAAFDSRRSCVPVGPPLGSVACAGSTPGWDRVLCQLLCIQSDIPPARVL
jgi:hypothetical protein